MPHKNVNKSISIDFICFEHTFIELIEFIYYLER